MAVLSKLDRYREIATLGSGGMATVVLAQDTLLGRDVALKRMHTAADPSGSSRLRREALMGASISHPNIVSIYDVVDTDEGDVVIVMEYVEGENLRDALARHGQLAPAETLRILEGVAAGLDAIHERGIVHRDVKPANILLGPGGAVKLADLGIAAAPDRTRITTVGSVLGSFSYMAPEQLEDAPVTPAIDIYALATVAYEALSGVQAHRESTPIAVAHAIATQPPPDLRHVWRAAPPAAAELLLRAMARDPAQRPRSAGELVARLRAALDTDSRATRRIAPTPRAAAVAAAPAAAAAVPQPPTRRPPPPGAPNAQADGGRGPRDLARILVPLALVAAAAGVIIAILIAGNSSNSSSGTSAPRSQSHSRASHSTPTAGSATAHSTPAATATQTHPATTPSNSTATSTTPTQSTTTGTTPSTSSTPSTPTGTTSTPTAAVASFYGLAASHKYAQAWALADPVFQNQLGGYDSFQQGQSGDKAIYFHTDRVVSQTGHSAVVAIETTSVRNDGTQQCHGTVQVQNASSGGWLLHAISIQCS